MSAWEGVQEISQETYLNTLKKKAGVSTTLNPLLDAQDGKSPTASQDARLVAADEVVTRTVARPERPEPPKKARELARGQRPVGTQGQRLPRGDPVKRCVTRQARAG